MSCVRATHNLMRDGQRAADLADSETLDATAGQRLAIETLVEALMRRKHGRIDSEARREPEFSENPRAELTKAQTLYASKPI